MLKKLFTWLLVFTLCLGQGPLPAKANLVDSYRYSSGESGYTESIQQFSITISSGNTSNTATLSTAVESDAFIILQGSSTSDTLPTTMNSATAYVVITNSTTITATRNGSNSDAVTVQGVVIDPTTNLVSSVQTGTITITSGSSNTATVTSVDTSRAVVFFNGSTGAATGGSGDIGRVTLTNATTVTAAIGTGVTTTATIAYSLVELADPAVDSVEQFSDTTTGNSQTHTITSVDTSRSFIAYGGETYQAGNPNRMCRVELTNGTTVTMTRTTNDTSAGSKTNVTVVQLASGVVSQMQRGTIAFSSQTSKTATITSAATEKTFTNFLNQNGGGTNPNTAHTRLTQTNATTITANSNSSGSPTVSYEALTFNQ